MNSNDTLYPRRTRMSESFPNFQKPFPIGYFSVDAERQYVPNGMNCKYVKYPQKSQQIHFDLNHGYENVQRKPESSIDEKLDHLLKYIQANVTRLICASDSDKLSRRLSTDFVCFRGLLRLLMCTPYEDKDGWCILATRFGDTIYLCALETDQARRERETRPESMKRILSYGFKFEQYIMTGKYKKLQLISI